MTYSETIEYLFTRLPMFQRKGPSAYKNSLENTLLLDDYYNHPHRKYKVVHVAGTNGKGSVSHMLASVFQSTGYKTGLYTSPHLKDFRERIRVDGKMMEKEAVIDWVANYRQMNEEWKLQPSFFELTVAMAFDYFSHMEVDVAVVEVGLGGRLDSTNIVKPEVSVITNIGLDHTALLGETMDKIAREKAGIIKPEVPVVVGTRQEEIASLFNDIARLNQSPIYFADQEYRIDYAMLNMEGKQVLNVRKGDELVYSELLLDLRGAYQLKNLPAVLKVVDVLQERGWGVEERSLYDGLSSVAEQTGLMGRWQVIGNDPLVVCDTGHNEDGLKLIVEQLGQTAYQNLHFVFGTVSDKDPGVVLQHLPRDGKYYFVQAKIERAMEASQLKERAELLGLSGGIYSSVKEGYRKAMENAGKNDLVLIGGSTFVVAEIL